MEYHPNIAAAAHLIADPARASMLIALLDGKARPAGELAYAAGVTPQTASTHLAKLLDGGLLTVESEGRHRYYRLAGSHVAQTMESLAAIVPADRVPRKPPTREARHLQFARSCYDHLAGRLGVAVTQALQDRRVIVPAEDKRFELTPAGRDWLADLGLDTGRLRPTRRGLARQCLDWTEREHHLAGPLGVQLLDLLCRRGWLRRPAAGRAVEVTPQGRAGLKETFGVDADALRDGPAA